jgi:uncharacterized protein
MKNIIQRSYWIQKAESLWEQRSILWLTGVRRSGKTSLSGSLGGVEYFDCELPRVRRMMEDPEGFWSERRKSRVVLDEIHRLANPSELLKIAADHYPDIKVLATGSSTLAASSRFRDTLTGRKLQLWLTPMTLSDMNDFKKPQLKHRLLHGGLPPFFEADKLFERGFQEWMDDYWAKDIQELFRLESRQSFHRFMELMFMQSGGIFEATQFAAPCEVSRTTIMNYLRSAEETMVAHVVRPYSTHRATEIVSSPRVYAFDTGFVSYYKGWSELRKEDLGYLWEHLVLNEIQARTQTRSIGYWRDKRGSEVDFVWAKRGQPPAAIECKWSAADTDFAGLRVFRKHYPEGVNYQVAADIDRPYRKRDGNIWIECVSLADLAERLSR